MQDGQARTRIFDAWGNLVKVEKTLGGQTLLELRRDGLNRVIMQHGKPNGGSGIVNSSDPVLYYLPDSQGRPLAVFEAGKVHPTLERQIPGPQSLVGCRESRDDDSDGVRDRETFVLPDATGSAAGFFDNSTGQMERVHYDPMGVPTCFPSGDINADGKTDWDDYVLLRDDIESSQYDDKGDTDADGDVDVWDAAGFDPKFAGGGDFVAHGQHARLASNAANGPILPRDRANLLRGPRPLDVAGPARVCGRAFGVSGYEGECSFRN